MFTNAKIIRQMFKLPIDSIDKVIPKDNEKALEESKLLYFFLNLRNEEPMFNLFSYGEKKFQAKVVEAKLNFKGFPQLGEMNLQF